MTSVIQNWVFNDNISMKQQSMLLSGLRGCDGIYNDDISKTIIRQIRCTVLNNAADNKTHFMQDDVSLEVLAEFAKARNKYSVHFYMHVCYCCEIIGFKHPDENIRKWFNKAYLLLVKALYLNPETQEDCDKRLQDGKTVNFEFYAKNIIAD